MSGRFLMEVGSSSTIESQIRHSMLLAIADKSISRKKLRELLADLHQSTFRARSLEFLGYVPKEKLNSSHVLPFLSNFHFFAFHAERVKIFTALSMKYE